MDAEKGPPSSAGASRSQLLSRGFSNLQSRGQLSATQLSSALTSCRSRGELSSILPEDKPFSDDTRFINEVGRIVGHAGHAHRVFPRVCSMTSRAPKLSILKSWPEVTQVMESCGFNKDFEFGIQYEAKRFLGGKVPLGQRLDKAKERMTLRKKVAHCPCATVQLSKALRNVSPLNPELVEKFAALIAACLNDHNVSSEDVNVEMKDGSLHCEVDIKSDWSLLVVVEALNDNLRVPEDPTQENELNKEFVLLLTKAGAVSNDVPEAMPSFEFERIQAELTLEFPEYKLTEAQFDQLRLAIVKSWEQYREVWKGLVKKEPEAAAALAKEPSKASFSDGLSCAELRPVSEARTLGLVEEFAVHGSESLHYLMEDAAIAQQFLKNTLAPNTEWGSSVLNDLDLVPADDGCRNWKSGADNVAPFGIHHDPGLQDKKKVLATAQLHQRNYEAHPPVKNVLDVVRICISFDSLANLHETVQRITEQLDVVWVHNKFGNPPCFGLLEVHMGLRVTVKTADKSMNNKAHVHICEIRLLHADVPVFKEGHQCYDTIQSVLSRAGVRPNHLEWVSSIVLGAFDCTKGRAAHDSVRELQKVANYVKLKTPTFSLAQRRDAEQLVDGLVEQALEAGSPADQISTVGTASPMQRKRALRKLDGDRKAKQEELGDLMRRVHKAFGQNAFDAVWACTRTPLADALSKKIAKALLSVEEVNHAERLLGVEKTDFEKETAERLEKLDLSDIHAQVEEHLERMRSNPDGENENRRLSQGTTSQSQTMSRRTIFSKAATDVESMKKKRMTMMTHRLSASKGYM